MKALVLTLVMFLTACGYNVRQSDPCPTSWALYKAKAQALVACAKLDDSIGESKCAITVADIEAYEALETRVLRDCPDSDDLPEEPGL